MGKNGELGKKSQLALAAKKCRPIKSYFATNKSTTSDKAGHPTPNRNCAKAKDPRVAKPCSRRQTDSSDQARIQGRGCNPIPQRPWRKHAEENEQGGNYKLMGAQ
jgi:ribosomal protein L39E